MDDLLKDAIADAKAVRETALENAKIALEEAFTPRLQSMLSKKIQSEMEEDEMEEDEMEERGDDEDEMEERGKVMAGKHDDEEMEERGDMMDDDEEMEERGKMDDDEEMDEDIIEIDGVKYAPVVSEEEDEDEVEEGEHEEEDDMEEDLDLESVIKELESEIEEGEHEDDEKDEAVEEEVDATTGIGSSDNKAGSADKSSNIGSKDKAKFTEEVEEVEESEEVSEETEVEEDIDLEEVLKALSEEEDEEEKEDANEAVSKLQTELDEHRNVVKYLRAKLNEVNLLNAKLLFTNKLFRSHGLSNDQKMKVVETFDRATTLREVKLVYSTLAESFGSTQPKTEIKESKGSASKAVASTKSKKQEVIAEGHEMRDRFKKLAGIL